MDGVFLFLGYGYNCNSYLVKSENEYVMIDSGLGKYGNISGYSNSNPLEDLQNVFKNNQITQIAITHAHLDHTGGIASLNKDERDNLTVMAHKDECKHLETPNLSYIDPMLKTEISPFIIDKRLSHGDIIRIGNLNLEVLHTAGHTEGSMCLYEAEKKWLFSGDTVFPQGSFGRVDFPGSNPDDMLESLDTLRSLEVNVMFAGHMEPILNNVAENLEASYKNAKSIL